MNSKPKGRPIFGKGKCRSGEKAKGQGPQTNFNGEETMGVDSIAYSIPPKMMRKIRADNDNLGYVFGNVEDENEDWQVESFDFGTGIEVFINILREAGYPKTAKKIDCEYNFYSGSRNYLDYDSYNVWIIPPSEVKVMAQELANVTFDGLKSGIAGEIKDRRGHTMLESLYESYLSDIESLKKFLQRTAEQGNYLLFAEA
jgi:hypothetical protein